jgi:hypothetical protein
MFDYSDLTGLIIAKYGSRKRYAEAAGMAQSSLSMKLRGKTPWDTNEMATASKLLGFSSEAIVKYFFTPKVH